MAAGMLFNWLFVLTLYPVLLIMYCLLRSTAKGTNGYFFGVSMGTAWNKYDRTKLKSIEAAFKKKLNLWLIVSLIVPLFSFFVSHFSIVFTIWMMWLLVCIFYPFFPFAKANKEVLEWKREQKLAMEPDAEKEEKSALEEMEGEGKDKVSGIYTEIKSAGAVRRVKPVTFLIPTILSLLVIPAGIGLLRDRDLWEVFLGVASGAVCTPLFYLIAWIMDRQKISVVSTDAGINLNYARAQKNIWKNLWLVFCWCNTVFVWLSAGSLLFRFHYGGSMAILLLTILYCVFAVAAIGYALMKKQKVEAIYREKRDISWDETDRYWKWGLIYCNPNDRHLMVEQRVGIGSTMNMATGFGKILTLFAAACLLIIPIMCVWMVLEEFTPLHLTVEEERIIAEHLRVDYEIPVGDILEVSVIAEVPDWTKVKGSAMDNLEKGTFEIWHEGKCEVFLNPENTYFLRVETEDTVYYLGGCDDMETEAVYAALCEMRDAE